jgi:acyl dehydratase
MVDDPGLGLDFARVVHGDQRFSYLRPVCAGDRLTCTTTIEEITSRAGNDFLTSRTDMVTDDGEPVVSTWSMLVVRGE